MLDAWMRENRKTNEALGDELGVSHSYVSRLRNNERSPSLSIAVKLERIAGIPPSSWVELEPDGAEAPEPAEAVSP